VSTATPPPRRRRMSRADRERQMLDVAEEIFGARGYAATSMDEVAERCGVSKPMIYEYFGSKEGLLVACIARSRAELFDVTHKAMAGATDPKDILTRGMTAYFEFVGSHSRSFATLLTDHGGPPESVEAIRETRAQQSDLIAGVLRTFAPARPEPELAAFTEIIMGGSERLALWQTGRPDVAARDAAAYMIDFCWQGLAPYVA
jgi:AcrR family transcriptional regulator